MGDADLLELLPVDPPLEVKVVGFRDHPAGPLTAWRYQRSGWFAVVTVQLPDGKPITFRLEPGWVDVPLRTGSTRS